MAYEMCVDPFSHLGVFEDITSVQSRYRSNRDEAGRLVRGTADIEHKITLHRSPFATKRKYGSAILRNRENVLLLLEDDVRADPRR